jgi:hypothetical protein
MATVNYLGGYMYGDGEYIVEFKNVQSFLAPMAALVITPDRQMYEVGFQLGTKMSVKTAEAVILRIRSEQEADAIIARPVN